MNAMSQARMSSSRAARKFAAAAAVILLLTAGNAAAQTSWHAGTGDWFEPANWTAGVPTNTVHTTIDNGGTAQIVAPGARVRDLFVGRTSLDPSFLKIAGGGTLSNASPQWVAFSYLGYESGAQGTATVTGSGSEWRGSQTISIGYFGAGTLNIENGGYVQNLAAFVGRDVGSQGTVTVSGGGSMWKNSGDLFVGRVGTGTLSIADGGQVLSNHGYIGYASGSQGTATVTGSGSQWLNSRELHVGRDGRGTLIIEEGGHVRNSDNAYVGYTPGSEGSVTVTGSGSTWTNSQDLRVGGEGSGTLIVADGGLVTARALWASLGDLFGNGTITVNRGAVLDADLLLDQTHGTTQSLPFGVGGTLTLEFDGSGVLGVGYLGTGTLTIADAVPVASTSGNLGYWPGSHGTATVTGSGSKWMNSAGLYVGRRGTGTLTIDNGAQVSNTSGFVATNLDSVGAATVTGTGSRWTNSSDLYVGRGGYGTLMISDRAEVWNTIGYVGQQSGSQGAAMVTGSGSHWRNSRELYVGQEGTGTLNIEDGGQVWNTVGCLGDQSGSHGTAAVTGIGSKWTNSSDLYVGREGSGMLTVADGGLVTARTLWASLSDLYGNGTIAIRGGAVLDADIIFDTPHGAQAMLQFGADGVLTLDFDGTGPLGTGYRNAGTIAIADGLLVAATAGYLGYRSGSQGTATVTGSGSKWTNSTWFDVGRDGAGMLTVADGGEVSNTIGWLGRNAGSHGAVTVSGSGSRWTNSAALYVGTYGIGAINIEYGGQVSNTEGYLGYWSGSQGAATVTGSGSTWTNASDLYVGREGSGTLTVADGGLVTARTLWASASDLLGDGTVTAKGGVLDADMLFDSAHGSKPTSEFGTGGALYLDVDGGGDLGAGYRATGTIVIAGGVLVASTAGFLGYEAGSQGVATVTGNGSMWTTSASLSVGYRGMGTLIIADGGLVAGVAGSLGSYSGSQGTVTVTGSGSKWMNSSNLFVGSRDTATLNIEDGGQVSNASGYLGYISGAQATATVTGDGSRWANSSDFYVGYRYGTGILNIEGGGQVSNRIAYLGYEYGSEGTVNVTGNGSRWTNTAALRVGNFGIGTLNIEDGGEVSNTIGYLGYVSGSRGTVTIAGNGSTWTSSDSVYLGGHAGGSRGTGTVTVRDGATVNVGQTLKLWSGGTMNLEGGTLRASSIDHQSEGQFHFSGGTMYVSSFLGNLVNAGGTLSPGWSTGTPDVLNIQGDYSQAAAGRLLIEIGGIQHGTQYDALAVGGQASLAGVLEVALIDGFHPEQYDIFCPLISHSLAGQFDELVLPPLSSGLRWDASRLYIDGTLSVVPEPATWAMLLVGLLGMAAWHRRRRR